MGPDSKLFTVHFDLSQMEKGRGSLGEGTGPQEELGNTHGGGAMITLRSWNSTGFLGRTASQGQASTEA